MPHFLYLFYIINQYLFFKVQIIKAGQFIITQKMAQSFFENLSRVYTFKLGTWPYTDIKQLNPYKIASQGYCISKPFILECCVCHHHVTVPIEIDSNNSQILLQQLSKHKQNCIYFGCEDLQQFQHQDRVTKQKIYLLMDQITIQLKQGHNLLKEKKKFPLLNIKQIQTYLSEEKFLVKSINQAYNLNWPQKFKILFFLQYFGWGIKKNQQILDNICLECLFCGRRISLENLKLNESQEQQNLSSKIQEQQHQKNFSPVSQHRYFCLWVNPYCSSYKGYTIYLQYLYDKIVESKSLFPKRPLEQTKKIRVQLDKYLQSFQQKTSQQFQQIISIFEGCNKMSQMIQNQQNRNLKKQNLFENAEKRMEQFASDVRNQIKEPMKKIKL